MALSGSVGVRADLRLATDGIHERLHEAEAFRLIAEGALSLGDYGRLLVAIRRFHCSVQPLLAAHPQTAALGGGMDRLTRIESDLRHMGAAAPSPCAGRFTLDRAEVIGCLYVVQGSTLGGRVIYRQLEYLFDGIDGRSFFLGSGEESARWQKVRGLLEEQPAERQEALRRGAIKTFAFFEQCLLGQFPGLHQG